MKLSVIIPTHNRAQILKSCLEKLEHQQEVDFEVIVVDDGSTDGTEAQIRKSKICLKGKEYENRIDLKYIKLKKGHQGTARNRGVEAAKGDIIVFIGDDIFAEPGFLKKHHDRHLEYPDENVVVLGFTTWDPKMHINSYMRFLENSGWQFGYKFLKPKMIGRADPYKFFYTSNISLKKSFFEKEGFNEDFVCYGWEDIELGYRLWRNHDMEIYYEPRAIAYHHHEINPSDLPKKMRAIGRSAVHFQRLHPDIQVIPLGIKGLIIRLAANRWTLPFFRVFGKQVYYRLKSWHEFMAGVGRK